MKATWHYVFANSFSHMKNNQFKFIPRGTVTNKTTSGQPMAWHQTVNYQLSES